LPAVLVFTLAAGAAHSVQITYLAEGLLYAPPDGLPSLAINDPWKLTFTIDYGVAGSGDSTEKTYPGAIVAYTLILEPSTPLLTVTDTSADIKVHNEAGNDFFLVHDTAVPATTLDGKVLYEIGFFVSDSIGTALDNTDIPGSALLTDLSPFDWNEIQLYFNGTGFEFLNGGVDSVVVIPEPTTALLLATGLAGFAAARRRRQRLR
jgi:hypothetical protein